MIESVVIFSAIAAVLLILLVRAEMGWSALYHECERMKRGHEAELAAMHRERDRLLNDNMAMHKAVADIDSAAKAAADAFERAIHEMTGRDHWHRVRVDGAEPYFVMALPFDRRGPVFEVSSPGPLEGECQIRTKNIPYVRWGFQIMAGYSADPKVRDAVVRAMVIRGAIEMGQQAAERWRKEGCP
jgi:hypothetical protein